MAHSAPVPRLVEEWLIYLRLRGHQAWQLPNDRNVAWSRNGRSSYRWLFLHAERSPRALTPAERQRLQHHLRTGHAADERVFVVVKFDRPEPKVLVLPASSVAEMRRIRSDKGGIPWDW